MLDEDFRTRLEWQLSAALGKAQDKSLRGYFCDGILDPEWEEDYLPAHVRKPSS